MLSLPLSLTPAWQAPVSPYAVAGRSALRAVRAAAVDDKAEVEEYFNNEGFNRWNRIYSEDGEVNSVQLDIRKGHAETVDKVLGWIDADGTAKAGDTFCDAGCGVGSLAIPLASRGATVRASGRGGTRRVVRSCAAGSCRWPRRTSARRWRRRQRSARRLPVRAPQYAL